METSNELTINPEDSKKKKKMLSEFKHTFGALNNFLVNDEETVKTLFENNLCPWYVYKNITNYHIQRHCHLYVL